MYVIFFLISSQNRGCGYLLEASNEYLQAMFSAEIRKELNLQKISDFLCKDIGLNGWVQNQTDLLTIYPNNKGKYVSYFLIY